MAIAAWPPRTTVVRSARAGNKSDVDAICRAMRPRLEAFLRFQGFDRDAADDIAAEVALSVIAGISHLRRARAFEAWFWTITRNQISTHLRRKRRENSVSEPPSPAPNPPDETIVLLDEHAAVRTALSMLSERDRMLLWLREVEGLSYLAIGSRMDITPATARVGTHRARRRLGATYEEIRTSPASARTTTAGAATAWRAVAAEA